MKSLYAAVLVLIVGLVAYIFHPAVHSDAKDNAHMISRDDRYFTRELDVKTGTVIQVSPLDGPNDHADTGMVALLVKTTDSAPSGAAFLVLAKATDSYKTNDSIVIEHKYINEFSSGYNVWLAANKK